MSPAFRILVAVSLLSALALPVAPAAFATDTGTVVINEFMASNGRTLADEDGDFEDWIELFNAGNSPVDLSGYGLSDRESQPFRWVFPEVRLASGEFLLLWASGKDRRDPAVELHTNFRIAAEGEPLLLTAPDGGAIDYVEPVRLARDTVHARIPDGGEWGVSTTPTPAAPNIGTVGTPLPPPVFSHEGGFYDDPFDIFLKSTVAGGTILYTLDGSEPDAEAVSGRLHVYKNSFPEQPGDPVGAFINGFVRTHVYSGEPVRIPAQGSATLYRRASTNERSPERYAPAEAPYAGTVVRARFIREGSPPSPVVSRSFFIRTDRAPPAAGLPAVSLAVPPQYLFDYFTGIHTAGFFFDQWRSNHPDEPTELWSGFGNFFLSGSASERPAHFEWIDPDGGVVTDRRVGLRVHGGTTRSFPQKSLRLHSGIAHDPRGAMDAPFFTGLRGRGTGIPVDSHRRIILRNSGNDAPFTRIRDAVGQSVLEPLGLDHQAYQPAVLFINGEFWGLTNVRERTDRFYIESHHGVPEDEVAMVQVTTEGDELDEGCPQDLVDFGALRDFIAANDLSQPETFAKAEAHLDIENFLLYHIANIYLKNTDWPGSNIRAWRHRSPAADLPAPPEHDGRWRYIVFDLDFAFGPFWGYGNDHNTLAFALAEGGTEWPNPDWSTAMLRSMLANERFRRRFIQSFADHMATTFRPERVDAIVDRLHGGISPYLTTHADRWRDFENHSRMIFKQFARERPAHVKTHVIEQFGLEGTGTVTFDASSSAAGSIRVNTITLGYGTPGLQDSGRPFPWSAAYFRGVPLEVTALPAPGFEFAGWREASEEGSALTLLPEDGLHRTALFRKSKTEQPLHYWSFNDPNALLEPAFSRGGTAALYSPAPTSEMTHGTLHGFSAENTLFDDPAGTHLRLNNPVGAVLVFRLPTDGYHSIRVRYDTRRSGSGAGLQLIEYAVDAETFLPFATVSVANAAPQTVELDFSEVPAVTDNPYFAVRIRFLPGDGGTGGNNRIDHFTAVGAPVLSKAGELAYRGIYHGAPWFDSAAAGFIAHENAWGPWIYHVNLGWCYVPNTGPLLGNHVFFSLMKKRWLQADPSGYTYVYGNGDWLYLGN